MTIPLPTSETLLLSIAVSFAVIGAIAAAISRLRIAAPRWIDRAAGHSLAPLVVGLLGSAAMVAVWGSLDEPGAIHDEQAYVLQAEIFARGRWVAEPPPVPEFFEQAHVLVEPHLAAKYPPGHSLLLVPGVLAGLPGLMPVLLVGATSALFLSLARRLTDPMTALLAVVLWSTSATTLLWRASYLSQVSSTFLWILALWSLVRWTDDHRPGWLTLVAASLGWLYLTRPLTSIGLALPIAWVVLRSTSRPARLTALVPVLAILVVILALQLFWQERTVDDWRVSPYAEYSRQYFPFVKPGFGLDPTPPGRVATPEITWIGQQFATLHGNHRVEQLPLILVARIVGLVAALGQHWRGFLIVLFIVGAIRTTGPLRLGLWSVAALLGVYLIYAHPAAWVVYYAEVFPVFFLVAAVEVARFTRLAFKLEGSQVTAVLTACLVIALAAGLGDIRFARAAHDHHSAFHRQAAAVLNDVPGPAVVFVRYPAGHSHHMSLIANGPDYREERLWVVYDRGPDNDRLLQHTDRPAYRLDTDTWSVERLR